MEVREVDTLVNNTRWIHAVPKSVGLILQQPTFNWKATHKYQEISNFEIEVKSIFMTNNHNIQDSKKVPVVFNWLGQEGLRFVQILNDEE